MNSEGVNVIYEVINEIQNIKWLIDEGPAHAKLTEAQVRLSALKDAVSAIAGAYAESVETFWKELHVEAENQLDCRLDLMRPVTTYEESMVRRTMLDGWSAWVLAKHIVNDRRAKIVGVVE